MSRRYKESNLLDSRRSVKYLRNVLGVEMNIQVVHTLGKYGSRLQAGIYIQFPEVGVPDSYGRYYRHVHEDIKVTDVPNDTITRCLQEVFERTKDVEVITFVGPSGKKIEIQRGTSYSEIRKRIREG